MENIGLRVTLNRVKKLICSLVVKKHLKRK